MEKAERARLLRAQELFASFSEEALAPLAERLEPIAVQDGRAFLVEGAPSDGLYFVRSGRARVAKSLAGGGEKDLAFLGPGECLGEMELVRGSTRSASAYAQGRLELLRLKSEDLRLWLDADAARAALFFEKLAESQSARLRRTSDEVALLYDLSQLVAAPQSSAADLLSHALARLTPRLPGAWSSEARVYDPFESELKLAWRSGDALSADGPEPAPQTPADVAWTDARTLQFVLRSTKRPLGLLRFRSTGIPGPAARDEAVRVLGAASRLLASALENVDFRTDEALRERLRMRSHGPSL